MKAVAQPFFVTEIDLLYLFEIILTTILNFNQISDKKTENNEMYTTYSVSQKSSP